MSIQIILPASMIPDGGTVRKAGFGATNEYTLKRDLKIHGTQLPDIKADGCIFLMGHGSINAYPESQNLCIHFDDIQDAIDFLQEAQLR